jgi:hypothetical protein
VAIGLRNLTEGAKNPLSEYNTAFRRLQMRRRMTPTTDLSTESTQQSPADPSQFEPPIIESVDLASASESETAQIGAPQDSIRLGPSTLENPVSALTEDPNFIEDGIDEEKNVESLTGMLDDLYNGETLPRLSELDVAFEMDEVEIVEEEPWDDNDSDSEADVDSGASEDEQG